MWFIGLLSGMILGSVFNLGEGTVWGGMLGALVGAVIGLNRKQARDSDWDARIAALERAVREMRSGATPAVPAASASAAQHSDPESPSAITLNARGEDIGRTAQPAQVQEPVEPPAPIPRYEEPVFSQPSEPSVFERAWAWLTGGNALVRVGVIVLFFGVAFLLKYAYEHTHVPIELRLIGVALGALVMLWCSAGACGIPNRSTHWRCRAAAWACCF